MGYAVPEHFRALAALGPTVYHRRSFAPVAAAYNERDGIADGPCNGVVDDLLAP
jgi:ribonuclease HII